MSYNPTREWTIAATELTFANDNFHWLYVKAPVDIAETTAVIVASENHIDAIDEDGYVYYKIGFATPVSDGLRELHTLWGASRPGSGGSGTTYNWKLHGPEEITGYLPSPSGISVDVDGTGAVVESVTAGQLKVTAINAQGETTPANIPAFDVLADSTEALVSWTPVEGATGYRVYDTVSGDYKEITGEGFDYLTFVFDTAGTPPAENTAAILQTAFTIENGDTVEITGENVTVETSIDPLDSTKKRVHLVVEGAGASHPPVTIDPASADLASIGEDQVLTINRQDKIKVDPTEWGYLYNWWVTQEDVAPTGWHVPTPEEWYELFEYIDDESMSEWPLAGGYLKSTNALSWYQPNVGATDDYNFNQIGSGLRGTTGEGAGFNGLKYSALLHTGYSAYDDSNCSAIGFYSEYSNVRVYNTKKANGISMRFVKDDSTDPGTVTDYDGNVYPTVKIGDQVWMAANFRGVHYNDGSPIDGPDFTDEEWAALTTPAYCVYQQTLDEKLADIDHNSTKNKQGGNEENNEFYHLTAAEKTKVENLKPVATSGSYNDLTDKPTMPASVTQITGLTILASGWVADGSLYKYELSNAAITADHICEVVPDDDAYDILVTAKPLPKATSVAGTVTMKVHAIPSADFTVTLNLYTKST